MGNEMKLVRKKQGDIVWACQDCDYEYGPVDENPKLQSSMRVGRLNELAGPKAASTRLDEPRFFYRQFLCPGCGLMWAGEVGRATDPILHDIELDPDYLASL
jgi:acetone carboxylase gamma subunit